MRGVQDTRRPVYFVVGANLLSAVLCPLLVYPAGLGLRGSAIANVTAQTAVGTLFVIALVRERVPLRPHPEMLRGQLTGGRDLLIRGAAFQLAFLSAAAVASRFGAPVLSRAGGTSLAGQCCNVAIVIEGDQSTGSTELGRLIKRLLRRLF